MSTTEQAAQYHKPLIKKYVRYAYPHFSRAQLDAIEELASDGGFDLSCLHELAVAKFLGAERKSVAGYDIIVNEDGWGLEVKYRRLRKVKNRGGESYLASVCDKHLRAKTAKYVWLTVFNILTQSEDHFMIPVQGRKTLSINFCYNESEDSYNQGDKYLVHRGFFHLDK